MLVTITLEELALSILQTGYFTQILAASPQRLQGTTLMEVAGTTGTVPIIHKTVVAIPTEVKYKNIKNVVI